ncbi:hypothetical protein C7446_2143 [Kushneria sinocarnis]|uniref:Uncharacterized protein n=1 Tax=Kushneria sinocarnis TaxID=595502 RepID=A0A420WV51_9GAMM|nr:hypothetical protein C7446_2143 [Kushneria sinocarnis]
MAGTWSPFAGVPSACPSDVPVGEVDRVNQQKPVGVAHPNGHNAGESDRTGGVMIERRAGGLKGSIRIGH